MSWAPGHETITRLLSAHELEHVHPNSDMAFAMLARARESIEVAGFALERQYLTSAFDQLWDAALQSMAALLLTQGLRATAKDGGHRAAEEAVSAQFGAALGAILTPMRRLRLRRHELKYPDEDITPPSADEVAEALHKAGQVVDAAEVILPKLTVFTR